MTRPATNCPSCGGPVTFQWDGAIQTTCPYCSSVLVRQDLDVREVGRKSVPPPNRSPIQVGTEGEYGGRHFRVTGRIAYAYGRGGWNEWHLLFTDGMSGWLSDAQEEYAVTFARPGTKLPHRSALRPRASVTIEGKAWQVASVTAASYAGVEGDLPFEYWDKAATPFADLRGEGGFATVDFSEDPPLFFVGQVVPFGSLKLRNLRDPSDVDGPRAQAKTLNCPRCGGAVTVRAEGTSVNVVCPSCTSILDATSPQLALVQAYQARIVRPPKIPLGKTGRMHGAEWTVLGYQLRSVRVEGVDYPWAEYLLHAPGRGYRYLTEYQGHWNDAVVLHEFPKVSRSGRPTATFRGERFKHFQSAEAETVFVLGEFPWQVRAGDRARTHDYVHPPRMLSMEDAEGERTWTLAEYTPGAVVWQAFGLSGRPSRPKGVYANQPSPHGGRTTGMMLTAALLLGLLALGAFWRFAVHRPEPLAQQSFVYDAAGGSIDRNAALLGPFEVKGRPSALGVRVTTDLNNEWLFLNFALIDQGTGRVVTFGRELSYYTGRDSDGAWSEGSTRERVRVPAVPPGNYLLRVDPEGTFDVNYAVSVERDVPSGGFFAIAFVLLLLPPAFSLLRVASFETTRWAESDYAGTDDD